ncbi:MAG: CBS domain-containing protein [Bacillota bacterium]
MTSGPVVVTAPPPDRPRRIIVPHTNTDPDALGAAVAARVLYPGAAVVLPGLVLPGAAEFASLHRYQVRARKPKELDLDRLEMAVVVDTRDPARLGPLREVVRREGLRLHLYDHHPGDQGDLAGELEVVEPVGATCTLLAELLQEAGVRPSPFEATALLLGIYADTDHLTLPTTGPRDVRAAAWLLEQGASLQVVARFTRPELQPAQQELLAQLIARSTVHTLRGVRVQVAVGETAAYVGGLARLVHKLCDLRPAAATFVAVRMEDRVHLVGRSTVPWVDAARVMAAFGGGGHRGAASATVRGLSAEAAAERLLQVLAEVGVGQPVTARDLMKTPVRAVPQDLSIGEAERLMLRYGYSGLVVVDGGHRVVGVISQRDVEKARRHGLTHAPVKGVMSSPALTIPPDLPLDEIQAIMVERDIGRLPVVEEGRLVGIVTRSDVLGRLYGAPVPHWHRPLYEPGAGADGAGAVIRDRARELPPPVARALRAAGEVARETAVPAYAVGGFVRDLLLGWPVLDVDIVVEGDGIAFARRLAERLGGRAEPIPRFGTAHVYDAEGFRVDVATARRELYAYAAALPEVEEADLREDLYRRDFTIGAMAIRLTPEGLGELVDFFGGYRDLREGLVRVLHSLSFVEDPTRILRAARFAGRYGMRLEPETERLAREAVAGGFLERVTGERLRNDLVRLLQEPQAPACLRVLRDLGALEHLLPEVRWTGETEALVDRVRECLAGAGAAPEAGSGGGAGADPAVPALPPAAAALAREVEAWRLYLAALLVGEGGYHSAQRSGQPAKSAQEGDRPPDGGDPDASVRARAEALAERLRLSRRDREVLFGAVAGVAAALAALSRPDLRPSQVVDTLEGRPPEGLLLLWLLGERTPARDWVERYWSELRHIRPAITGEDLRQAGLPPGPAYALALGAARAARLDGRAVGREAELAVALDAAREAMAREAGAGPEAQRLR